jgi:hypothetical protein
MLCLSLLVRLLLVSIDGEGVCMNIVAISNLRKNTWAYTGSRLFRWTWWGPSLLGEDAAVHLHSAV